MIEAERQILKYIELKLSAQIQSTDAKLIRTAGGVHEYANSACSLNMLVFSVT